MNRSNRTTSHHYYSVFTNLTRDTELTWFGFNERVASWQFYRAIRAAERKPDATSVVLRRDGQELASVPIKQAAIA